MRKPTRKPLILSIIRLYLHRPITEKKLIDTSNYILKNT